jgi:hypothetical protein
LTGRRFLIKRRSDLKNIKYETEVFWFQQWVTTYNGELRAIGEDQNGLVESFDIKEVQFKTPMKKLIEEFSLIAAPIENGGTSGYN